MKFEIGAMSVGDILNRSVRLLLARLPAFYAINLIVLVPVLLAQLLMGALQTSPFNPNDQAQLGMFLGVLGIALLLLLAGLVVQPLGEGATLYVVWQEFVDLPAGVGKALRFALRRFLQLFLTSLMRMLVVGAAGVVGALIGCVPGMMIAMALGPAVGAIIATVIIMIPAVLAGFIVWIFLIFIPEVVIVEGIWGPEAFSRSVALTKGFRLRITGVLLLLFVINAILQLIFFFANQFIPYHELVPGQFGQQQEIITNFPLFALTVCIEFLVGIVVGTYLSVCTTLLYFDIRIRKEGFDLEMAARPPAEPSAGPELAAGPQY
jgi:hypothetical protein